MVKYMHTLDGMPAQFYTGQGICFNNKRVALVDGLRQIRKEQKESRRIDVRQSRDTLRYGYITVRP